MSSGSDSSFCSTCSESQFETSLSDISLNDEDIDYVNHFTDDTNKRQLFYLKIRSAQNNANDKTSADCGDHKGDNRPVDGSDSTINTNDRLGLSYTRITSGIHSLVFQSKAKLKRKVFRRKSSKKKEINDKKESICENKPSICVSFCEDIDKRDERENQNKLFDIIDGKYETIAPKSDHKMILMYLMVPNESQTDCLLYSYPKPESEDTNPTILRLKGMFVTLSQIVSQITNQSIKMSSIAINGSEDSEQIYKIGFIHEKDSLLVLALPEDNFSDIEVEAIIQTIERVMKFMFTSLDSAFKDESNHESLHHMFATLEYLLTQEISYSSIDSIFLNSIKRLLIDDNLAINLSDSLSEYEAMDWLSEDSTVDIHHQNGSQYIVIGSCLLFKGFLLSSHLSNSRLKDIYGFLSLKGLLALHKRHSIRLVFWSQVFPTSDNNESIDEYNDSKYFISIVGFDHMIHCTLIEMPFISAEEMPIKANDVIINESIRLLKSHFTKSGIIDEIHHCFDVQQQSVQQILDPKSEQKRYKSLSSLKDLFSLTTSSQLKSQIYHSTSSLSSLGDSSVSTSLKSYSSPSLQHSFLSRTSSSATSLSHINCKDMSSSTCGPNNCIYLKQNLKLPQNLICYLDIEDGQQVFAGPLLQWPKDICEQILKRFAQICYEMSRQFRQSVDSCLEIGKTFQITISSNFLSPNKLKSKKSENEIHLFEVIGRHERNTEFYVCFKANGQEFLANDFEIEDFMYRNRIQRRLL